ncbi:MAG: hypothetical protein JSR80_00765 [Verrucomicrobia bacterium]|nr:hypothetical protein [Verrucomicrobiota bacterium]
MEFAGKIEASLLALDAIPLVGTPPPFPFAAFEQALAKFFQLQKVTLQCEPPQWITHAPNTSLSAFFCLVATPLDLPFYLSFDRAEITLLLKAMLHLDDAAAALHDPTLHSTLVHFAIASGLAMLGAANYPGNLKIHLANHESLPPNEVLCIDFAVVLETQTLRGRLLLPPPFLTKWRQHFLSSASTKISKQLGVEMGLEGGKVEISAEQWKSLKLGDILLLDSCTVSPNNCQGPVALTYEGKALLNGELTASGLQL